MNRSEDSTEFPSGRILVHGSLSLFGFPSTPARAVVIPRSRGWRAIRSGGFLTGGLALAPLVGMVPPHAPWAAGALGVGAILGIRKWQERLTLVSFTGQCPRCGGPFSLKEGIALRSGMAVPCDGCHHDSILSLTQGA